MGDNERVKRKQTFLEKCASAIDSWSTGIGAIRKSLRRFYRESVGIVTDVLPWLALLAVIGAQWWSHVEKIL